MADIHAIPSPLPLTPAAVREAHTLIKPYIHRTPLLTNKTLNRLASTGSSDKANSSEAVPRFNFFFKCENYQRIGAFKARGAFHAVLRLIERLGIEEVKRRDPPTRIPSVATLTIGDGLRTPVGVIPWSIISDPNKHAGAFAITEDEIKKAMRLVIERMKVVVEPSAVVGLAVCLFNEEFRRLVAERQRDARQRGELGENEGWDIGIVFSGGNTTVDAIAQLFASNDKQ
ncbi:Pyridoxal phosphate-dependent enzyme, beta subunit [Ascosphaera apis ARSEF 7405]|uniref:Pyridoxal phosphate-dependent enzyme, beta subunit n=1 Tax=Ascosphaera apis ARSEF 7405 TaxID=392613 RepID=A0A167XFH5_9EURO|nr:Pyridoxal phosphate-dependent enzyme, beta subunit [Ascosphaera apis ARSEF 7405]